MVKNSRVKRILLAKPGLCGHDRGISVVAMMLRDAGMEVIYTGLHQISEAIVKTAIQEGVDFIGLNCMTDNHMTICPRIINLLRKEGADIPIVLGGIIPEEDRPSLIEMGIVAIFGQASTSKEIVNFFQSYERK
jgi:methylmalonyl-CoA mutase C-terminal domain/subunit